MSWLEDFFQQNLGKQIAGYFGALGALCALIIGVLNLKDRIQPPAVLIVTTKAPLRLQSTLIRGADPTDPIFTQKKLGTVLMEITNESPTKLEKATIQLRNLKDFRGMVVVDGSVRDQALSLQQALARKVGEDAPVLQLPDLAVKDTLVVQAFGENWNKVDPELTGTLKIRKRWIIGVTDSVPYHLLFGGGSFGWFFLAVLPILCAVMALLLLKAKGTTAPSVKAVAAGGH